MKIKNEEEKEKRVVWFLSDSQPFVRSLSPPRTSDTAEEGIGSVLISRTRFQTNSVSRDLR